MNNKSTFLSFLLLFSLTLFKSSFGQNQIPQISNLTATADTVSKKLNIQFNLSDAEESDIKISLLVFNETGSPILSSNFETSGDIGFPVKTGKGKSIMMKYPRSIKNIQNFSIKIVADDEHKIDIQELVDQVDSVRMKQTLANIYGERNYENKKGLKHIQEVKDTLEKAFTQKGLLVEREGFKYKRHLGENIIGKLSGQSENSKIYLLTSHFDTTEKSPGADDNGSGVAGMLEAMRVLSNYNFSNTLVFVGFDLEEQGWLGSQKFMKNKIIKDDMRAREHKGVVKVGGAINFDMIGYYSNKDRSQLIPENYNLIFKDACDAVAKDNYRGNFILNTTNELSRELGVKFQYNAGKFVPSLKVITLNALDNGKFTPQLTMSDHGVFWFFKFKAIHIGDGGPTRNLHMDSSSDVLNSVNYSFMTDVVKASVATLAELAELSHSSASSTKVVLISI